MKKLKLQKALLAICLALPITLTMSNGINASHNADKPLPINNGGQQQPNNVPNESQDEAKPKIGPQDAVLNTLTNYLNRKHYNEKLDVDKTKEYLQEHIRNDIDTYLTTRIQSNLYLLSDKIDQQYQPYLDCKLIYNILAANPLEALQPKQQGAEETKVLITEFQNLIQQANKATPEDQIIRKLFKHSWIYEEGFYSIEEILNHLTKQVTLYKESKTEQVDKKYKNFANHLDAIVARLEIEHQTETSEQTKGELNQLKTAVNEFSNAYKRKIQQQNQARKAILAGLLNKKINKDQKTQEEYFAKLRHKTQPIQQPQPPQQTDTTNAFTFKFWQYLTELQQQQQTKFTRAQYAKIFNNYIQDDIVKYIVVHLLILNQQIIPVNNPELAKLIDMEPIYTAFTEDVKGTQISKFWQSKHYIDEKKEKTKEDKLILLLCVPGWLDIKDIDELYPQTISAIDDYNREVINIKDKNDTTQLIDSIAIESINQLIQLDYHYQKQLSAEPIPKLKALSELIQGITNAYKSKHNKPQEQPQQQNNKVQQTTDQSNSKTAQKNGEQGLAGKILAHLKSTTENLSKIINTLLP